MPLLISAIFSSFFFAKIFIAAISLSIAFASLLRLTLFSFITPFIASRADTRYFSLFAFSFSPRRSFSDYIFDIFIRQDIFFSMPFSAPLLIFAFFDAIF